MTVDKIIENTDYNHSGQIDYTEYLVSAINKDKLVTRERLQKVFKAFDLVVQLLTHKNGDGQISKDEWEKCFGNHKFTDQDWAIFLEEVDSNKDGNISMDELFEFLEKACLR